MKELREVITRGSRITIVLSHEDLDGIASAFLLKKYAEATDENTIIVLTSMSPISDRTYGMLKSATELPDFYEFDLCRNIDRIIVADRALSLEDYKRIKNLVNFRKFEIYDHHIAQENEYRNIQKFDPNVEVHFDSNICATLIIAHHIASTLKYDGFIKSAEVVDCWDTFKWKPISENPSEHSREEIDRAEIAVKQNKVACTIGPNLLYEGMQDVDDINITNMEGFDILCKLYNSKLEDAYNSLTQYNTIKDIRTVYYNGKLTDVTILIVKKNPLITGDKFSLVADRLLNENSDLDIILFVGEGMISLRGRKESEITPLAFAKMISPKAGGHELACGLALLEPWTIGDAMINLFLGRRTLREVTKASSYEMYYHINHQKKLDEFMDKLNIVISE